MLKGRDILSIWDLSRGELEEIFRVAEKLEPIKNGRQLSIAEGKVLATVFMEPSTRTRLSFTIAMLRLGGKVVDFGELEKTSVAKGETLADTIRVIDGYGVDIIVLRHPNDGASRLAAEIARAPVINAGDGAREHPTQTILDLYTIWRSLGRIDGLTVGIMGDLKYGRTPSSLLYGLSYFSNVKVKLIAPKQLQMREEVLDKVEGKVEYSIHEDLREVIRELDVLYVTRIQKERFPDPEEYEKVRKSYVVNLDSLKGCKDSLIVMHPLPRVDELSTELDNTRYAKYFDQSSNGVPVRAALISLILGLEV